MDFRTFGLKYRSKIAHKRKFVAKLASKILNSTFGPPLVQVVAQEERVKLARGRGRLARGKGWLARGKSGQASDR
ncbi:MAG: hypothetical protein FWE96_08215 [Coriobacteriia bacterium]|nr:hypothetical protein [Coriobacteriia bacterium]